MSTGQPCLKRTIYSATKLESMKLYEVLYGKNKLVIGHVIR